MHHRGRSGATRRAALRRVVCAALALVVGVLTGCTSGGNDGPAVTAHPTVSRPPYSPRPNIVFVLTDDLSSDLVQYMPHVVALKRAGMTFTNYSVTDSLCCPSRSSILTGKFPHNTHVFTNNKPDGGMSVYREYGGEQAAYGPALQRAGFRTALMGKYLNGYDPGRSVYGLPDDFVPPGWSTWAVAGSAGYRNFDYKLNQNHKIVSYGSDSDDYLTSVITQHGQNFINDAVAARKPFTLELATFTPHRPFTPAPRDVGSFLGIKAPRGPSFNRLPVDAPPWMRALRPLHRVQIAKIDTAYEKRVEAVQSTDRAIGALQTTLRRTGQLRNTVFVFTSDNGFHMGQHGLDTGKRTAFDTDVHVPLVIAGPGIPAGSTTDAVTQNIDLAPTFEELAGAPVAPTVDGHSLVPLLHGTATSWRTIAAVEHHGPDVARNDPDVQPLSAGNPPSYVSLRGADWTYTHYADGSREYYDHRDDPAELANTAGRLSPARIAELDRIERALEGCRGGTACWAAARPEPMH